MLNRTDYPGITDWEHFSRKAQCRTSQKFVVSFGKASGWGKAEANADGVTQDPVVSQRVERSPSAKRECPSRLISYNTVWPTQQLASRVRQRHVRAPTPPPVRQLVKRRAP